MNIDLKGKVAVVTGGTGVLGGSISKSLTENGVKVAIIDIAPEATENKVKELGGFGDVMGIICNVLKKEDLESAREQILRKWGRIDILVNAAGGNLPGATLAEDQTVFDMKIEDFNNVTNLNMNGTVY
ncbi:MAG: SDR family NAD(P)-dependent oxidoreductase, partial [Tannerella sp.]|nr:SDR family NAD(P)-dependent oxidoreductase [Tannerella sp.]